MRYVIIGFGCAGYCAARTIRQNDPDGIITVFSEHSYAPYNPMLTTYYAAGKIPFESLFPFGSLEDVTVSLRLDMHSNERVASVAAASHEVVLDGGKRVGYDRLLIASGASAFAPQIQGLSLEDVYFMRTVDDAVRIKNELDKNVHNTALIVGASMVGIKVVELLNSRGVHTVLADMAPDIFPLAAYHDVSKEIERRITEKGVKLALGCSLVSAEKVSGGYNCRLSDGSSCTADLVVLCIGTRANISFVDPGEIRVNRGIVVDERMASSCPDVYAAGDCCEGQDLQSNTTMIIGLWANAAHQGTTAGANMTGVQADFDGNFLHNITHFMDMDFIGFGDNRLTGEILTSGDIRNGLFVEAVVKDHRLAGVNILDNYRISGAIKNYLYRIMEKQDTEISPIQKGILIKEGLKPSFIEKLEGKFNA